MKGIDLKIKRTRRRVSVTDLAEAMGCSPSYVSQIERRDIVNQDQITRYLNALSGFKEAA